MSYKIIVSRFNENIYWLSDEIDNCIIYNKGDKLNIENEIILENVGRESHTYLHYIITNYDNLPDVVVFTQGKILDHIGSDDVRYLIDIKNQALENSKSQIVSIHHNIEYWNLVNGEYYLQNNYKNNKPVIFLDWFKENINMTYPEPLYNYSFGIFSVKKELILKHPIEYYKRLILEVDHHINPAEGHFFERAWYYIFN
jgi:hypothetical protein